jgi:hypothetical protein
MSPAPNEVTSEFLAARVRRLGNLLGQVIAELSGPRVFELVEYARGLAKSSRAGNAEAARQLFDAIRDLPVGEAFEMAMAFTTYFELVNLAEEHYRTRRLRQHRAARRSTSAAAPPVRESIEAAIVQLKTLGVTPEAMQGLLDRLAAHGGFRAKEAAASQAAAGAIYAHRSIDLPRIRGAAPRFAVAAPILEMPAPVRTCARIRPAPATAGRRHDPPRPGSR